MDIDREGIGRDMRVRRINYGIRGTAAVLALLAFVLLVWTVESDTPSVLGGMVIFGAFLWFAGDDHGPAEKLAIRMERWLSSIPR